jgi:PAS domain S-box-containing protein
MKGSRKNADQSTPYTVLIADDNKADRKLLRAQLEAGGYCVLDAENGFEGLQLLQTHAVDAVISDILMPKLDGFNFCFEIRHQKRFATLPFIIYSATYTSPADIKISSEIGVDKHLKKPARATVILEALREVLSDPKYREPRKVKQEQKAELFVEYNAWLVTKLEEKNIELGQRTEQLERVLQERLALEERLRQSEERFRALTEHSPDGVALLSPEGLILYESPSVTRILGYAPGELLGRNAFELMHPEDIPKVQPLFAQLLSSPGNVRQAEYRYLHKDGSWRWIDGTGANLLHLPSVHAIVTNFHDVTDRREAEEQLKRAEERYRAIFNNATVGIFQTTPSGQFITANPAMARTLGYDSPEELIRERRNIAQEGYVDPNLRTVFQELMEAEGEVVGFEYEVYRKDGRKIWVAESAHAIRNAAGEILYYEGFFEDITERKRAEEKLRESEEQFRQIAETINQVFWMTDPQKNRLLYVSPAYEQIWGGTLREVYESPTSWLAAVHHEDRPRLQEAALTKQVQGTYDEVYRIVRPDGSVRWIHDRGFPVKNAAGEVYRVTGVAEDITPVKEADDALRQSEQRYRTLVETMTEGIVQVSNEAVIQFVNDRFCEMVGYRREELIGKVDIDLLVCSEDRPLVLEKNRLRQQGVSDRYELRLRKKSGELLWTLVSATPVTDASGTVIGSIGTLTDITLLKHHEEQIRQQASLLEITPSAILVRDLEHTIKYWNRGAERLYGWTRDEAVGRNVLELLYTMEELPKFKEAQRRVMQEGQWSGELKHRTRPGKEVFVHSVWTLMRDERGVPRSVLVVNTDITEKKTLQERLIRAQRLESIGTLAGGIAHDFNNILGIILGHLYVIEKQLEGISEAAGAQKSLDAIQEAATRGTTLVKQLLTFARKTETVFESVLINDLVTDLLKLLTETFPKTITIKAHLGRNLPPILGDNNQLHQVLLNLCVNARDAMPSGGILELSTSVVSHSVIKAKWGEAPVPEYIMITVADTGIGMDEETMSHIFEPFFSTKEVGKGTGLGLATSHGIVESHNGFIDVESEKGRGTAFKIYLPVQPRTVVGKEKARDDLDEIPGGDEVLLLIEDEEPMRELVKSLLESKGYTVLVAENGREGIQRFAEHQKEIALVLSDMGLPKLSGENVFYHLRQLKPTVPVIIASGYLDSNVKSKLFQDGMTDFLQKPYHPAKVLRTIRAALDKRKVIR